jgi:hypothetical protein
MAFYRSLVGRGGRGHDRFWPTADGICTAYSALEGKSRHGVTPSTSAARILVCFVEGLRVIGKTGPTRTTSQATADALLDRFIR